MDPIEKAIRNAFEKGNADDRAFREKVYRSAFAALDRALQANPGVTVEMAINRRKSMQAKIAEIESEYLPAIDSAAPMSDAAAPAIDVGGPDGDDGPSVPVPTLEDPTPGSGEAPAVEVSSKGDGRSAPSVTIGQPSAAGRVEPEIAPQAPGSATPDEPRSGALPSSPGITPEPTLAGAPSPSASAEVAPDRDERRARRRFPTGLVVGILLLAAIAAGAWWAMQSGLFRLPGEIRSSQPATVEDGGSASGTEGAPQTPGAADQARNWITVFSPSDPTHVNAPSDAKAEVMEDDSGSFLRVRSGNSGSAISFDVGQGVLEQLTGKHAVFDIVARAEEGKDTQMSVDCNFGELGDCGRKRYAVGHEKNEYLFDVTLPDKRPGAAGTIAINSDFENQGKSVDIYQIRVSVDDIAP